MAAAPRWAGRERAKSEAVGRPEPTLVGYSASMHRRLLVTLAVAAALAPWPAAARIVLVGVDGGSWNLIDPMVAAGELPHLAALMKRGVTAELETVEPVTSPVVWTSIATGRSPEAHGVGDFFATGLRIEVPTTFERLAAAGLRVGLYDYLMTWPPTALPNGFVIPGWLRKDDSVFPTDVWQRAELTPFVNEYDDARTSQDYLDRARLDVREKAPRFIALADAFDLDVGAVSLYAVDMTSHRFWHGAFPAEFDPGVSVGVPGESTAVRDALRGVDRSVGQIVAALESDDVLLVVSDHGFQTPEDGGRNVWVAHVDAALALAGLDPARDGFSLVSAFGAVSLRVHPGQIAQRDAVLARIVELLRSFQTSKGEALFRAVESIDIAARPPEHRRPLSTRFWQWLVEKAVTLSFGVDLDPTAHAVVFALPDDSVLLESWPDAIVQVAGKEMPLRDVMSRQLFTGEHHDTAIFLAAGGPIASGRDRARISVLDLSPLLFYLAKQPIPDDLEGRLPTEILKPGALAKSPPRRAPAVEVRSVPRSSGVEGGAEDPALVEKLRALGYIE